MIVKKTKAPDQMADLLKIQTYDAALMSAWYLSSRSEENRYNPYYL